MKCSKYLTLAYPTAETLLSWGKLPYELSFLSLFIYSCMSVGYPSLFSRACLVTLYYWYQMNSEFERLERLEELAIQYSQPERETILHNRLLGALTFKPTRILFAFLYRCNPLYRNLISTTTLVHRTTVHMWKWFNCSDYFVRLL